MITIDTLLNLVPDSPEQVLSHLRTHPELASQQDSHGYSLIHAATSYAQLDLLRALIQNYHVDPDLRDEDGETCLFAAETADVAHEVLNLGVDINARNNDGLNAAEATDDDINEPSVAEYLREVFMRTTETEFGTEDPQTGQHAAAPGEANGLTNGNANGVHPPPLPGGVEVNVGTMHESDVGEEPDPEFRRRIEELAARPDFQGEEGQRALRDLVSDAVSGLGNEGQGAPTRRRLG